MKASSLLSMVAASVALSTVQPAHAQIGNTNPTGVTGEYNGSITTAGDLDPFTGNGKRSTEELSVAGAVGAYPLKWSRNLNTRGASAEPFGDGSGWRHSYQWGLWFKTGSSGGGEFPYEGPQGQLSYPDGRVVSLDEDGNNYYFSATGQRTDLVFPVGDGYDVHLADGGIVRFRHPAGSTSGYDLRAEEIVDPFGQVTSLVYNSAGRLWKIIEPAQRYLEITYQTYSWSYQMSNRTWTNYVQVISKVQAFAAPGAPAQEEVNYEYSAEIINPSMRHYYLTRVNYADGGQANYTYYPARSGPAGSGGAYSSVAGEVKTCDDVRYSGPMKRIKYEYQSLDPNAEKVYGLVRKQKNLTTGQTVSEVVYPPVYPINGNKGLRTEIRGDGATRSFQYVGDGELDSYTDFKNQRSYLAYEPAWPALWYQRGFTDARGKRTWTTKLLNFDAVLRITYVDAPPPPGTNEPPYLEFTYTDPAYPQYLASRRDENANVTYYDRDGNHRIWQTRYPDGSYEQFAYNGFGQVEYHLMTSGGLENIRYDDRGLKTSSWPPTTPSDPNPQDHPTLYFYYTSGPHTDRLLRVQDPRGNSTSYEYNLRGQITKVTHQDATYTQSGYYDDGTLAWTADENHPAAEWDENQRTRYTYDEYKRVVYATNPLNQTTTYYYGRNWNDPLVHTTSNWKAVYSPMGKFTHQNYDENWRLNLKLESAEPANAVTQYGYDEVGNLSWVQDPRGNVSTFGYDARNRKTSATDPAPFNNQVTEWQYDPVGNKTKEIRPDGTFRSWNYDEMNRVSHAHDWRTNETPTSDQTVTYTYGNVAHDLTAITDQKGAIYSYAYDGLGRKVSASYPADASSMSRSESWQYDAASNRDQFQNTGGQTKHFHYDNRNRQDHSWWDGGVGPEVQTQYDPANRVQAITTNSGETSVSYGYDAANRQIWEDQALAGYPTHHLETHRDADGNRTDLLGPGGVTLYFDYTGRNQLSHIYGGGYAPGFHFNYDASGNLTQRVCDAFFNNFTNISHDSLNRVDMIEQSRANNVIYARSHYQYDSNSRELATWRDEQTSLGERFRYDPTNQISAVWYNAANVWTGDPLSPPDQSYSYTPDKLNRSSLNDHGAVSSYAPNAINQYGAVTGFGLGYDGNFNISYLNGGNIYYDADNRVTSIMVGASEAVHNVYDGLGRCVLRNDRGATRRSTYDGWNPFMEWGPAGNLLQWRAYGAKPDELLLTWSSTYGYLISKLDREGSVVALLDTNGQIIEQYSYDVFGLPTRIWDEWGNDHGGASWYGNRFTFTGREYFAGMGLYDYRHRWYLPQLGRFLQTDPVGLQVAGEKLSAEAAGLYRGGTAAPETFADTELNLYRFCGDDPVNKTDPTGLITIVMAGFGGPNSSNQSFIDEMKKRFKDAVVFGRHQADQKRAVDAVKQAIKNGDKTVNIAGYSRGGVGAIQTAAKLGKEGISVDRLVTVDPVTATGNNGTIAVPSNVQRADNSFQRGARMGITDFPGTALAPAPNVHNTFYRDGLSNGYPVRHENMPAIVDGD